MTRLYLVRHGETQWNLESRTQGSKDISLTEKGLWQANRLAERFMGEKIESIYSSDLKRAYNTAKAIGDRLGIEVKVSLNFREMNFGCWEGKNIECIKEEFKDIYSLWMSNPRKAVIPGGEELIGVQQRALKAVNKIMENGAGGNVVLVSHGITIKTLIFGLLDIDLMYLKKIRIDNGSISIIDFRDQGNVLVTLNDTCHLKEGYADEK